MSDLHADYAAAGFASRIGFGDQAAVLVVDAVTAYTDPGSPLYLATGGAALEAMRTLVTVARAHQVPVVFTKVSYRAGDTEAPMFFRKVPALWVFAEESAFARFPDTLAPAPGEFTVAKHYASAFFGTSLASWLTVRRIDTVIICGYSTSGCVRASALDALQYGFRPIVAREAVADRGPGPHEANLFDLDSKYADVVDVDNIRAYLSQVPDSGPACPGPHGATDSRTASRPGPESI